jgi:hypothetical protein
MKQIKFRSRRERVLHTTYIVMYAFQSMELVPVFQVLASSVWNSGIIRPECAT